MNVCVPTGLTAGFTKQELIVREWGICNEPGTKDETTKLCGLLFRNQVLAEPWIMHLDPPSEVHIREDALVVDEGVLIFKFPYDEFCGDWASVWIRLLHASQEEAAGRLLVKMAGEKAPEDREAFASALFERIIAFREKSAFLGMALRVMNQLDMVPEEQARAALKEIDLSGDGAKMSDDIKIELMKAVRSHDEREKI